MFARIPFFTDESHNAGNGISGLDFNCARSEALPAKDWMVWAKEKKRIADGCFTIL